MRYSLLSLAFLAASAVLQPAAAHDRGFHSPRTVIVPAPQFFFLHPGPGFRRPLVQPFGFVHPGPVFGNTRFGKQPQVILVPVPTRPFAFHAPRPWSHPGAVQLHPTRKP